MARRFRLSARVAARLAWCLIALLPACAATQEWIYDKPRLTPAQLDRDKSTCRKLTMSRTLSNTFDDERVDREAFNRCMRERGYTVKAVKVP